MKPNKEEAQAAFEKWNPAKPCESISVAGHSYRVNQRKPFVAGFKAAREITPEMIERVVKYLNEHACHCKIDNSTQYDAFVYHLLKAALGGE